MNKPKAAKEDPAVTAAREREQRRAEAARTSETQALLLGDTMRRFRRFGRLGGSSLVGTVAPAVAGTQTGGVGTGVVSRLISGTGVGGGQGGGDVVLV